MTDGKVIALVYYKNAYKMQLYIKKKSLAMARKCHYFVPMFSEHGKFVKNLISASIPHVVALGQLWTKSIKALNLDYKIWGELTNRWIDGQITQKDNVSSILWGRGIKQAYKHNYFCVTRDPCHPSPTLICICALILLHSLPPHPWKDISTPLK